MRAATAIAAAIALLAGAAPASAQPEPEPEPEPVEQPAPPRAEEPDETEGPDADQPVSAPTTPNSETGDAIKSAVTTGTPHRTLRAYHLEGTRLEDDELLRGFLDEVMPVGNLWTPDQERDVTEFCNRLGYFVSIRSQQIGDAYIEAYLNLHPITLVRRISIDVKGIGWLQGLVQDTIFAEDVKRRLRLQVGRPIPLDEVSRQRRIDEERMRIRDYLRDEGFFEATVQIKVVPDGLYAVRLDVDIETGPTYYIGEVKVVGNRDIPDEEIAALFRHKRLTIPFTDIGGWSRRFNRAQLKRDIDAVEELYKKRGFPGVRVRTDFDRKTSFKRNRKAVDFTVVIRERRRVEVVLEGADARKEGKIREQLTLDEEGSYDDFEIQRSAQAIRRFYQSDGYFEATVLWERVSFRMPGQLFDRIVFTIDEGPKLKVKRIVFSGNRTVTDATLRDLIKTREYPRFFLASGGYATSLQLEQDVQRILAAYRARGYPDVQVHYEVSREQRLQGSAPGLAAAILSDLPADGLYVRFLVDEGKRLRVHRVDFAFKGPHDKTPLALLGVTKLRGAGGGRAGSAYTEAAAEADGNAIRNQYFRQGYPRAKVNTKTTRDDEGRIVVTHEIEEGLPVKFGKIVVRGNFKTRDWVIREELELPEGAAFTLGRAERAQRNLRTSGLFSNVRFHYVGLEDSSKDVVNVVLNVQERYDYLFDYGISGGYSTDTKLFIEGQQTVPHILGTGVRLDLSQRIGQEILLADGKLLFPRWVLRRLVGLPLRADVSGFWRQEFTERFGDLTSFGTTIGAGIEGQPGGSWDGWFLGVRYNFRQRQREEELVRIAGASDDIEQTRVRTNTGSIGPQLVIDKRTDDRGRRNPLAPEAGFRVELSALFADEVLGGDDRFVKLGFKGLHYWKLGDRFLITNGLRWDQGIPLGGSVLLPEVERFFAGGDTTVRGFEEDRMHTEVIEESLPPLGGITQFRVIPAGGNIRAIHNIELQVQVWDKSFIAGLPWASAVFVDTGLITNSLDGFEIGQLRHSLGLAFWRLVTPAGSFSFEWALPLDPHTGDNPRGRLHLNLGFVFK